MSQPRFWIAAVVVAAAVTPSPVRADRKNEIRAVTFDEDAGTTRVHVQGAQTPTFTVYKLERPSRVVIDVPQARLGEALRGHEGAAVLPANTWAVSTIAAQELDDGGLVVRVIVTLARPGRYDVKTVGNDLVVMVMPRDPAPKVVSAETLAAAQAEREQARQAAQAAERGRAQAEKSGTVAQAEAAHARAQAAAAQAEATKSRQDAAREIEAAARTKTEAEAAKLVASREAEAAKQAAAREAAAAKQELARTKTEAEAAKLAASREAEAAKAETTQRRAEAEAAKADAAQKAAELVAARHKAEVAERAAAQERAEATAAQADAAKLLDDNARMHADASRVRGEAEAAKAEAARMRAEAEAARKDAEAAKGQAAHEKLEAEAARSDAEKLLREAKQQVAALDKKAQAAQALEDKARAANAAAQAREEAAGAIAARVAGERAAAEAASRAAAEARDHLVGQAGADRDKAISDAREAEARLAQARQATFAAEQQRAAAEAAATAATHELEATRAALASVEQQRTAAEAAASQAARQRGEAEAAADEAAHRRSAAEAAATAAAKQRAAAELAASQATQRKSEAEAERTAAEQRRVAAEARARTAKAAADAAEHQRVIAEEAANAAVAAKRAAEGGLAELSAKRLAAERAATELETRSKAEAKAQAEVVAARARQASADELAQARAEASRLAGERQHAEAELADRRKAAFAQKAEADRLRLAAAQARDAADREAARRATLAEQRAAEEQALARIKAQKAAAELAATQPAGKPAPTTASKPGVAVGPATMTVALPPAGTSAAATASKPGVAVGPATMTVALPPAGAAAVAIASKPGVATGPAVATAASPVGPLSLTTAIHPGMTPLATLATAASSGGTPSVPTAQKPGVANPPAGTVTSAPAAAKPARATPLAQVRDIAFTGDAATGRVTIALAGDATVTLGEVTQAAAELLIDHAQLGPQLERKLDVSRFGGPVRAVASFRDRRTPDRVRLIAELASPATPTFERDAGVVRWSFAGADPARRPVTARPVAAHTQDVPSPKVGGFGAASTPVAQQSVAQLPPQGSRRRVYHGQTVDVHLKDAPIRDLLRLIADTGRVSIVVPDTIDARVTLDLTRVPWDQALEVILSSHQLWYRREGNLYRIAPRKELDAEDEAEAARRDAALKAEAPRPQLVPLNYSSAADLAKKLEPMLSPHGKIAVDERTNQLIVTDVSGNREQIARLALSLDTQTPQISIEARIVEANSTFLRQIGIQWGGRALAGATGGNATGLVWPSSISVIGGNVDSQTVSTGVASPSDFAVNLPAATGSGEGGALGLSLGSIGGNFNINLRLSALEDAGSVRIISSPKVTVLNNKLASIASGVSIPISTVSATGTQTQFVQADLRLDVTPTVSQSDCAISMNLSVSKNAPDFGQLGARGDPTIQRREARTSMLVADGETSVLGGIYTRTTSLAYRKIPFLGDLPVLGWLFKNRREQDDRTELLVFITPKITNRALLRCGK